MIEVMMLLCIAVSIGVCIEPALIAYAVFLWAFLILNLAGEFKR
jgi:hypothetical protein